MNSNGLYNLETESQRKPLIKPLVLENYSQSQSESCGRHRRGTNNLCFHEIY